CNRHSRSKIAAQSALNRNLKCQQSTQTIRPDGASWTPKKKCITRPSSVNEHKKFAYPPVIPLRRRIDTSWATFPDVDTFTQVTGYGLPSHTAHTCSVIIRIIILLLFFPNEWAWLS